jgi:predicted HTH transcriptional regulator
LLFRVNYIEQMGTGIGRMRDAARKANVAEPDFEFDGFFKVTFKRNPVDATRLTNVGSQEATAADRIQEILAYLNTHGMTSSTVLAKATGLSSGRVRVLLRELVKRGSIEKIGDNRYARYIPKR